MDFDLGKKLGPLPMGVWIAVIVGGLGLGYFINKNMAAGSTEEPSGSGVDEGVGTGGLVPVPWNPPDDTEEEPSGPTDNAAWGNLAVLYLQGLGYKPTDVDNAVRKYLSGMPLSVKENAWLSQALLKLGPPPEPIAPVDVPEPPEDNTNIPKPKPPVVVTPSTPGWSNDVPFAIRAAFPAALVKAALARTGHSNTGTHINKSDLVRGLNNIGHRYGTTVNVTDVAVLVTWQPPKQPGIRLTSAPTTRRAGMPVVIAGQTTLNGKNAYVTPIAIQRYVNGKWTSHATDGGGVGGKWSTTLPGGKKGETRRYRFVVTDGKGPKARSASTTHNVRFT